MAAALLVAAHGSADADVDGKYKMVMDDMGGSSVGGDATIKKVGKAFTLDHSGVKGARAGIGLKGGKGLFFCVPQKGNCGVIVYELKKDGSISGKWTAEGAKGKLGTETGKGGDSKKDFGGSYTVSGTNPGNSKEKYSGTLEIDKYDDYAYELTWTVAGTTYKGMGMKIGKHLGVSWGASSYAGIGYEIKGRTLDGMVFFGEWDWPASDDPCDPCGDYGVPDFAGDIQKKR